MKSDITDNHTSWFDDRASPRLLHSLLHSPTFIRIGLPALLFYMISILVVFLTIPHFPEDPDAYPFKASIASLQQQSRLAYYIPGSTLFKDYAPGIVQIARSERGDFNLLQYDYSGVLKQQLYRIGEHTQGFMIHNLAIDWNKDGCIELLCSWWSDESKSKLNFGFILENKTIMPFDTLSIPNYFQDSVNEYLYLAWDPSNNNYNASSSTIYAGLVGQFGDYKNRFLAVYSRTIPPRRKFILRTLAYLSSCWSLQDSTGQEGAIIGFWGPSNGATGEVNPDIYSPDERDDGPAVMRVTAEGEVLWYQRLMTGGGQITVSAGDAVDTVFAAFGYKYFKPGTGSIHLFQLDGATGEQIGYREEPGELQDFWSSEYLGKKVGALVSVDEPGAKRFEILSSTGNPIAHTPVPRVIDTAWRSNLFEYSEGKYGIAFLTEGPSVALIDARTGKLLARTMVQSARPNIKTSRMPGKDGVVRDHLLVHAENMADIYSYERSSYLLWIILRYKYMLLALLIPPAAVLTIFTLARYTLVKRRARLQEHNYLDHLRQLSDSLHRAQEEERLRISRDLHDQVGQSLSMLIWSVDRTTRFTAEMKRNLLTSLRDTTNLIREISQNLRPQQLESLGLVETLRWELVSFEEQSGIKTELITDVERISLDGECEIHLYRVMQEGLSNILKHAEASRVVLEIRESSTKLSLMLRNDGNTSQPGMQIQERRKPLGLVGMRERLRRFNGTVQLIRDGSTWVTLLAEVPIRTSRS